MRCYHKILRISYKDHVTNEEVRAKIQQAIRPHEDLTIVKKRKLKSYGRVCRSSALAKAILQDTVKAKRGGRRRGRQNRGEKTTSGNGQAWSSPSPRGQWRRDKNGGNWLWSHSWCPIDPRGWGIGEGEGEPNVNRDTTTAASTAATTTTGNLFSAFPVRDCTMSCKLMVAALSSLAGILRDCSTIHSGLAPFLFLFSFFFFFFLSGD